jgi:hypothetical protein
MISHKITLDLFRISMLVYNYSKDFEFENSEETIEEFIKKNGNSINNLKLNNTCKKALLHIYRNIPSGKVYYFINDKDTDTNVGITLNDIDQRICIVFRGSESLKDWYYDFEVEQICLKNDIMVHSGFYNQLFKTNVYKSISTQLKKLIKIYPDYTIYVTGHSLGGALATLCGYCLSNEINKNIIVVSFASPRIGNNNWKNAFNKNKNLKHFRVTYNRDIVTAFPTFNYKHVGDNIRIFKNKTDIFLNYKDNSLYDFTILRCWKPIDHTCESYYKHLLKKSW